jgi:pSer/pThr/pTyr-binding forkhead associated (FHA) protein
VIICSRCGKDNQKHYKFCLGCGAKLEAAPAAAPAATEPPRGNNAGFDRGAQSSLEVAKTALPPNPASYAAPTSPPQQATPSPVEATPFAASPSGVTARPPGVVSSVSGSVGSGAIAAAPVMARAPTPAPLAAVPATAPPGAARDMIPCPKCGKPVVATYAFCGACGQRIKPSAGGGAGAAAPQKTMFMAPSMAAPKTTPRGHLTLVRPDGTEGGVHPLQDGENLIGRGQGSLFDADPYLSPRHAEFLFGEEGLMVRDLRSLNGVFMKIVQEERLESGDVFRIGQELLRFDVIAPPAPLEDGTEIVGTPNPGYWGRISVVVGRDVDGPAFPLFDESVVLGRERGDILFPEDGYVSGTHAQITLRDGQVFLSDLGSSNGTFARIRGSRVIPSGSLMLLGQQLFRASYR